MGIEEQGLEETKIIWGKICRDLNLENLGPVREKRSSKYPEGFSAKDPDSGSYIVSCPGRLVYYSFFDFGSQVPAYKLYDVFSKIHANKSDLEAIPRGSQEVSSFNFQSFLVNLVNNETEEVHEFKEGKQLREHLDALLQLAREKKCCLG